MKVNKTKYPQYETYIELCKTKTESEIADIMQVNRRTVRRYKEKTGIKPKPSKLTNKTPEEWIQHFNNTFVVEFTDRIGRIDFVTDTLAIEYNGEQHYDTSSMFYSKRINETYNMKRQWALQNGYQFIELNGKDATEIYKQIVDQSGLKLTEPTADDFAQHNTSIVEVLHYLETHTKAETAKYFNISENRIYKFVQLIGYENVREWRKTHKFTQK